ncbi:uncharacterized protein FA14DRAFT_62128 [Meira miltonrushii]|uniref:Mannose 6-phosphate receptor domain-containing protein n=1 Tax=Meira miltonrushii TaxID=1280837 RepID=A0A316VD33_9BASI|nr:uncharacterized protein FA14DRAFT_62128 [Meira miltonrushii]PWN33425.1 hypothetical protein FA14DRAFT_62128 [Meira miltonrushii]
MKSFILTYFLLLVTLLIVAKATPFTGSILARNDDYPCSRFGGSGLLKLGNNGTALYKGFFFVVTDDEKGDESLRVRFEDCTFPGYGYTQGSSRNSHGSMGAPVEFFGIVKHQDKCLTASTTDIEPDAINFFRFQNCSIEDDNLRLRQFFAYQIGSQVPDIAFVGAKNTTEKVYKGAYSWTVAPKISNSYPRPIRASSNSTEYVLSFVTGE